MQYLTIALTKGRLAGQTMELFEKAGFFCEELKDKKSRKLIFTNEEQKLRFFLSKGPDVPTYVEYGHGGPGPAPAHPYIRPAYDTTEDEAYEIIRDGLREAIDHRG